MAGRAISRGGRGRCYGRQAASGDRKRCEPYDATGDRSMTFSHLRSVSLAIALALLATASQLSGQQAAGAVSGVVLTTDDPPRPVRRAIVSMRGNDLALGHHVITDDEGRFEIKDLPAGRYAVSAKREAFVTLAYGATRPEWPGIPLAVAEGQK